MPFVSSLIGRPVTDVDGARVGRLDDLIATPKPAVPHPEVVAIVVERKRGRLIVPFSSVAVLVAPAISLWCRLEDVPAYISGDQDLYLVRDVLDKQIIDTNGVRVVRVNDLELARVNHHFLVANVDFGGAGLLRRIGLDRLAKLLGRSSPASGMVSWHEVELLRGDQPIRLKVPGDKLAELHPADLAEIISDLSQEESSKLLASLDVKTLADTLEEVEPEFQASLVRSMPDEKVADVLEEMAPDEAADLLAELPQERSQELLELMEGEEAADVRRLLAFPEESAGGIMTTDYVSIRPELTVESAMAYLRQNAAELESIDYLYVTDADERMLGVLSLHELVLANPTQGLRDIMHRRYVSVQLQESQNEVAHLIAKYDLRAIPVLDGQKRLHGIVTADDALDKILPTRWKKRLPRLYH
jgi:CBS domain-containing protein/sporulation protein YlmC with PRC-barrel domain